MAPVFSTIANSTITSVNQFVKEATADEYQAGVYFRGVSNCEHELIPSIARFEKTFHAGEALPVHNRDKQELSFLNRFRRYTYEHRGRIYSNWETLFLARHHYVPVRLMDWSTNPLVALYFACLYAKEDENEKDGAVWWFKRSLAAPNVDVFERDEPLGLAGVRIIFPFYPSPRMTAQSGVFTIHHPSGNHWIDLRKLESGKPNVDILNGGFWLVQRDRKKRMLQDLLRLGINRGTLFPDLDGFAQGMLERDAFAPMSIRTLGRFSAGTNSTASARRRARSVCLGSKARNDAQGVRRTELACYFCNLCITDQTSWSECS